MFLKVLLVVSAVQLGVVFSESVEYAVQSSRPRYLADLQSFYLDAEALVWTRIESFVKDSAEAENSDAIEQRRRDIATAIIAIHQEVFFGETFESTSYWRSYLIYGIENLKEKLSAINETLEENYGFLYDANRRAIVYDVSKVEQWTREAMFRRLRDNVDALFDATSNKQNVMQHIRSVGG